MADDRIKKYWSKEMEALLDIYQQFQTLLPSEKNAGALHAGEDGRYVEHLIREYLRRYLPKDLEVLIGFILRPAVGCGGGDRARVKDEHEASGQLDILVYDTAHYPVYQRFGDSVIAPPEGVIGVISVKKYLRIENIRHEAEMLEKASYLCVHKRKDKKKARSPFTALIAMEDKFDERLKNKLTCEQKGERAYNELKNYYSGRKPLFYEGMINFLGSISEWGIYKRRPSGKKETKYLFYEYKKGEHYLGFQMILQSILSVYYENTSSIMVRPGFIDNGGEGCTKIFAPIAYHATEISRRDC